MAMDIEDRIHGAERRADKADSRIEALETLIEQHMKSIDANVAKLVTQYEFAPVKLLVYGMCACILTGFLGAVLSKVFTK